MTARGLHAPQLQNMQTQRAAAVRIKDGARANAEEEMIGVPFQ